MDKRRLCTFRGRSGGLGVCLAFLSLLILLPTGIRPVAAAPVSNPYTEVSASGAPAVRSAKAVRSSSRRKAAKASGPVHIDPPVVTPATGPGVYIKKGTEIVFTCPTEGIKFFRYGVSTTDPNVSPTEYYESGIDHVYMTDNTLYVSVCATNYAGSYSDTLYLEFNALDVVEFSLSNGQEVLKGTELTFSCNTSHPNFRDILYAVYTGAPPATGPVFDKNCANNTSIRLRDTGMVYVYAFARYNGIAHRDTVSVAFHVYPVAPPVFMPDSNTTLTSGDQIALSCPTSATDEVKIYYLIGDRIFNPGAVPQNLYDFPLTLTDTCYVYAYACVPGYDTSEIIPMHYNVQPMPYITSSNITDGSVFCALTTAGFEVELKNVNFEGNCSWRITSNPAGLTVNIGTYSGQQREKVSLIFPDAEAIQKPYTIVISEQKSGKDFTVYLPRKASKAANIVVDDLIDDYIYCHGVTYRAHTPADKDYSKNDNTDNYTIGPDISKESTKLHYKWHIRTSNNKNTGRNQLNLTHSSSREKMYEAQAQILSAYKGNYWYIQPYTCDESDLQATPTAEQIKAVIPQDLYHQDSVVIPRQIVFKGGDWVEATGEDAPPGCTFYNDEFNTKSTDAEVLNYALTENYYSGSIDEREYPKKNGSLAFQVYPYNPEDSFYQHYQYHWIWDTANFELDTVRMKKDYYTHFGVDDVRICLRVKENKVRDGVSKDDRAKMWVKFEVRCRECQERADLQNAQVDFYKESEKLEVRRVDSIGYGADAYSELVKAYTPFIQDELGNTIIDNIQENDTISLCGNTWYKICATFPYQNDYGINGSLWKILNLVDDDNYRHAGDGCGGFDIKTKKLTGDDQRLGRYYQCWIRPYNKCFTNLGDTNELGRHINVFLRATPVKANIVDTLEVYMYPGTDLVEEIQDDAMPGGVGVPGGMPGGTTTSEKKLMEGLAPILLCNNSGLPGSKGVLGNEFLVVSKGNSVYPQNYAEVSTYYKRNGGYGLVLPPEAIHPTTKEPLVSMSVSPYPFGSEATETANDTNVIRLLINANKGGYSLLKDKQYLPFGLYVANECGPGDTAFFAVNIIDTLEVYDRVVQYESLVDTSFDTLVKCEGEWIAWNSSSTRYIKDLGEPDRNTDKVDYVWSFPSSWRFVDRAVDSAKPVSRIQLGQDKGYAELRFRNRCGLSSARHGDYVDVNAFTRVNIKLTGPSENEAYGSAWQPGTTFTGPPAFVQPEYLLNPCRGSLMVFAADTFPLTEEYKWIFPADWKVIDTGGYFANATLDSAEQNVAYTVPGRLHPFSNEMRVMVQVGATTGYVEVIGKKEACFFRYDNVFKDIGRDTLPFGHREDSIKIPVRPYTGFPYAPWGDMCARDSETMVVFADTNQDVLTRRQTYFTWKFPTSWWSETEVTIDNFLTVPGTLGDSAMATFVVPDTVSRFNRIEITSHRYDCPVTNKGETTILNLNIIDTLSLDPSGVFADEHIGGRDINPNPCEGDTVIYYLTGDNLTRTIDSVEYRIDSVVYYWNGGRLYLHAGTDSVDTTGWRVLNGNRYAGKLTMIVGRSPMVISARAASFCGLSAHRFSDTIRPTHLIRDTATWLQMRVVLCENEEAVFEHSAVEHATSYEWHYPWGSKTEEGNDTTTVDTIPRPGTTNTLTTLRRFRAGTVFDTGWVFVVPYNVCGTGPVSDSVNIRTLVPAMPMVDSVKRVSDPGVDPAFAEKLELHNDTVSDLACLRTHHTYRAYYSDTAYGKDTVWRYKWRALAIHASDSLAFFNSEAGLEDTCMMQFFKEGGRDIDNFIEVAVRHRECKTWGSPRVLRIIAPDTVVVTGGLQDYLTDLLSETGKAEPGPCAVGGSSEFKWVLNKTKFGDTSVDRYQFLWRHDPADKWARKWALDGTVNKMDGSGFDLMGVREGEDATTSDSATLAAYFYTNDSLHVKVPNGDSLLVTMNVENRCGIAHLPTIKIKPLPAIKGASVINIKDTVKLGDKVVFCDKESITFQAFNDTATSHIWLYTLKDGPHSDTIGVDDSKISELRFIGEELVSDTIYALGLNGCGAAEHRSNPIVLDNIMRVRPRPVPDGFDAGYISGSEIAYDSFCMREDHLLKVSFPGGDGADSIDIKWTVLKGGSYTPVAGDPASVILRKDDVRAEAFQFSVKSKVKVCQNYSDSLIIKVLSMDTIAFVDYVDDEYFEETLGAFDVVLDSLIRNAADNSWAVKNAAPCEGREDLQYNIVPGFHWSLQAGSYGKACYFAFHHPDSAADTAVYPEKGFSLGGSKWTFRYTGTFVQEDGPYSELKVKVGSDTLVLHVIAHNVCGVSRSKGIPVIAKRKPVVKRGITLKSFICSGEPVLFERDDNRDASVEKFLWTFPADWTPTSKEMDALDRQVTVTAGIRGGDVTLTPTNYCGPGETTTYTITDRDIQKTPKKPVPAWPLGRRSDYTWTGPANDTVEETVCLHNTSYLPITRDTADGDALEFRFAEEGSSNIVFNTEADTLIKISPREGMDVNEQKMIKAWVRYPTCNSVSDTLYIRIKLVDTLSISAFTHIQIKTADYDPLDITGANIEPCPESELGFIVEGGGADAVNYTYKWIIPSDWTFKVNEDGETLPDHYYIDAPATDSTGMGVVVRVGHQSGPVSVVLTTPPTVLGCAYTSRPVTTSAIFSPREALQTEPIAFIDRNPCVGSTTVIRATPTRSAKAYRWKVPSDWKIQFPAGIQDHEHAGDTVWFNGPDSCMVTVGQDTGVVTLWAMDTCSIYPVSGSMVCDSVYPFGTARFTVSGLKHICVDKTEEYKIIANAYGSAGKYALAVGFVPDGASLPEGDYVIDFFKKDLFDNVDSSVFKLTIRSSGTLTLTFTPVNGQCAENTEPLVYAVKADNVPEIDGTIIGPDLVCADNVYKYTFRLAPGTDIPGGVSCDWNVPRGKWEVKEHIDDTTVLLRYIEYPRTGQTNLYDTIECSPRGLCGTAAPVKFAVKVFDADPFGDTLIVDYLRPCVNTDIKLRLKNPQWYTNTDTVKFVWNTPKDWIRHYTPANDSADSTSYTVRYNGDTATVSVRKWVKGACGLSKTESVKIWVRDSAERVRIDNTISSLRPCYREDVYSVALLPPYDEIDTVIWTLGYLGSLSGPEPDYTVYSRAGGFPGDSLVIDNPASSGAARERKIQLAALSKNECGNRDTVFILAPLTDDEMEPMIDVLHASTACPGDTAEITLKIPEAQVEQGVVYNWTLSGGNSRKLNNGIIRREGTDTYAVLRYIASTQAGETVKVILNASNSCNAYEPPMQIETVTVDTARLTVTGANHIFCGLSTELVIDYNDFCDKTQGYKLEITPAGLDASKFKIDSVGGDRDRLRITMDTILKVSLLFTPYNALCASGVQPVRIDIYADTVPYIKGEIEGAVSVCEDNIYRYIFRQSGEYQPTGALQCEWSLQNDMLWDVVSRTDNEIVLHFKTNLNAAGFRIERDTLSCIPSDDHGRALPVKLGISLHDAIDFNDTLTASDTMPCLGTSIEVALKHHDRYDAVSDSVKFVWASPQSWTGVRTDSLTSVVYTVQYDGAPAWVTVRKWTRGACGLSRRDSIRINVRDSAAKVCLDETVFEPHPCFRNETYSLALLPNNDVDSVSWSFDPNVFTPQTGLHRAGSTTRFLDSLVIGNPMQSDGRSGRITVRARAWNECGSRDTSFVIEPVSTATPFIDDLHATRVCGGDTGYLWMRDSVGQHLREGFLFEVQTLDSVKAWLMDDADDDTWVIKYIALPAPDVTVVKLVSHNACFGDTSFTAYIVPFEYEIAADARPIAPATTFAYGKAVELYIGGVSSGRVDQYAYTWGPEERVVSAQVDNPYQSQPLVKTVETFYVEAVQKEVPNSAPVYMQDALCKAYDTLQIHVDSLFALRPLPFDTVCVNTEFEYRARTIRTDSVAPYTVEWQILNPESGEWETKGTDLTFVDECENSGLYHYRVAGSDVAYIYKADTVETVSHSDTVYFDIQVYNLKLRFSNVVVDESSEENPLIKVPMGLSVDLNFRVEDGTGSYDYTWETGSISIDRLEDLSNETVNKGRLTTTPVFHSGSWLTLWVRDTVSGCEDGQTVEIDPEGEDKIPNTFTPNNDGHNDRFLEGTDVLIIYSRWGEQMVKITDGKGWDGTYNGKRVRPGEYLYVAEICKRDASGNKLPTVEKTLKGVVTVKY